MNASEKIISMMGQYPVIKLSLKSAKQPNFKASALQLRDEIVSEFDRHNYTKDSHKLSETENKLFKELLNTKASIYENQISSWFEKQVKGTDRGVLNKAVLEGDTDAIENGLNEAYDPIKTKKYEEGVLDDGYMGVKSYGICFCKKSCIVGRYGKQSNHD